MTQCLSVPTRLKELGASVQVHWAIREDLAELIEHHPHVDKVWRLNRKLGLNGLLKLIKALKKENYSHIYDAHNNLRSHLICLMLRPPWALSRFFTPPEFLRKSQKRILRLLLFQFRKNLYEQPFSGQRDLLEPLEAWGLSKDLPSAPQLLVPASDIQSALQLIPPNWKESDGPFAGYVALAPSAAYELKRWPLENWAKVISTETSLRFVLLGGADDHFVDELRKLAPDRVLNLAGKTSLLESAAVILNSKALIANDTGLLHVGEQLGVPCIALMGPAPFGFPSRDSTVILQRELSCRPCSKHGQGPCINPEKQKCLRDIHPEEVSLYLHRQISEPAP